MRPLLTILFLLLSCYLYSQNIRTIRGMLVDSNRCAVQGSAVILMTRSDSMQIKLDYCKDNTFQLTYSNDSNQELLLYISAIGYNSRYIEVDKPQVDLGEIIMYPLSIYMDEVTVSVKKPISHKFERGKDEYTIPGWLANRSYDVSSLLSMIPGLIMLNDEIQIAGAGKPTYLINGLPPRMGEVENLTPKDIEKVTIIRMPGAKFGQNVIGLINIITKKTWHDYLSIRLKNEFSYTNVTQENPSLSVSFKKKKFSQYFNYSYSYLPLKYDLLYKYETTIPEEKIHYQMVSDVDMYEKSNKHTITYSPKFKINDHSFLDLQYFLFVTDMQADYLLQTDFPDKSEPNLFSRSLTDSPSNTQYAILRYDNKFNDDEDKRLTFNTVYTRMNDDRDENLEEKSIPIDQPTTTTSTAYQQTYRNEVLSSSLDYKFTLWDNLEIETGASYGNLWTKSGMSYSTNGDAFFSRTRSEDISIYLNADHSIKKLNYQIGIRGQYEYRHRKIEENGSKKTFYWLPSAGLSYRFNDDFNFMLYYNRTIDYPTENQLNPIISYNHKYLYFTGNPSLKPIVSHSLMGRLALPYNLALTCKYFYKNNDIIQTVTNDKEDPKIIATTYVNLHNTNSMDLTLSWNYNFKFYYLSLNTAYSQYYTQTKYIDREIKFNKPSFSVNATHSFNISKNIQADIYMYYRTPYNYYNVEAKGSSYAFTAQLQFSLMQRRMNIKIAGKNFLYRDPDNVSKYKHVLFASESKHYKRGIFIGITYNFNNFNDLFQKNNFGEDIIKRAQTN